jgi:tRNA (guanine-N7-)-methyltransferase
MQTRNELIIEPIGVATETLRKPIDWAELFGNSNPVEMEIGSGKGTFITEQARQNKDINYFGIEWARWYWKYTCDRLRRHGCLNARAIRAEAGFFIDEFVTDGSISVLHIYFPDPWPKARHNKRRLIQEKFMPKVLRILKPGGRLQVVTDHADYWAQIEPTVRNVKELEVIDYNRPGAAKDGEFVGTNFERKYAREGRPFYAIAAIKRS